MLQYPNNVSFGNLLGPQVQSAPNPQVQQEQQNQEMLANLAMKKKIEEIEKEQQEYRELKKGIEKQLQGI